MDKIIWMGHDPWFGLEILKNENINSQRDLLSYLGITEGKDGIKNLYIPNSPSVKKNGLIKKENVNGIDVFTNIELDGLILPKNSGCLISSEDEQPIIIYNGYSDSHHSKKVIISLDFSSFLKTKPGNTHFDITVLGKADNILKELDFCGFETITSPFEIKGKLILIVNKN